MSLFPCSITAFALAEPAGMQKQKFTRYFSRLFKLSSCIIFSNNKPDMPEECRLDGCPWRSCRKSARKMRAGMLHGEHHSLGKSWPPRLATLCTREGTGFLNYQIHTTTSQFPTKFNLNMATNAGMYESS